LNEVSFKQHDKCEVIASKVNDFRLTIARLGSGAAVPLFEAAVLRILQAAVSHVWWRLLVVCTCIRITSNYGMA
jgi:hypothetical protein